MSFAWSKKLRQVAPAPVVQVEEVIQSVVLPTVDDKISVEEHKNGERLVISREEDNEVRRGKEEDNGEEVVLPRIEDSEVNIQEE